MADVDRLLRTLKGLFRLARIVSSGNDDKAFPNQQIEYLGKNCDATFWFPYGMHANLPPDVLAIAMSLNGNTETRYTFPSSPKERQNSAFPNPLEEGDILFFNPTSKAYVYFRADGDIIVNTPKDLTATVTGDANVNATGKITVDGSAIELGSTITALCNEAMITFFNAHVHTSAVAGSPTSAPTISATVGVQTTVKTKAE